VDVVKDNFRFFLCEFFLDFHDLESDDGMILDVPVLPNFLTRGTLVSVCGDTKGAHEIGGFMSPSAKKMFCLCLIEHAEINLKISSNELVSTWSRTISSMLCDESHRRFFY
jgi:hypothetical protein